MPTRFSRRTFAFVLTLGVCAADLSFNVQPAYAELSADPRPTDYAVVETHLQDVAAELVTSLHEMGAYKEELDDVLSPALKDELKRTQFEWMNAFDWAHGRKMSDLILLLNQNFDEIRLMDERVAMNPKNVVQTFNSAIVIFKLYQVSLLNTLAFGIKTKATETSRAERFFSWIVPPPLVRNLTVSEEERRGIESFRRVLGQYYANRDSGKSPDRALKKSVERFIEGGVRIQTCEKTL